MNRLAYLLNNIRIRKKLIVSYLFVVFLPVLIVGLLLTGSLRKISVDRAVEQSVNNVEKILKRVEETLKVATDVSNKIYLDKQLKELANKKYESDLEVYQSFREYTDFTDYLEMYQELSGIRFYADNPTLKENWSFFRLDERVKSTDWFKQAWNNQARIGWFYLPDVTKGGERYLSLVRQVYYNNLTFSGMLVITVNTEILQSIVEQEPFDTMILNEEGEILASKDRSQAGRNIKDYMPELKLNGDIKGMEEVRYQGGEAKIILQGIGMENSNNMLRVVSIIPLDSILQEARTVGSIAYAIILSSLILSILLILFFSGAISKRIQVLSGDMRKVALGDLSVLSVVKGKDEIGQLSRHLNFMVGSIRELMVQIQEVQAQQHELQNKHNEMKFRMLANQVNPHFLFNVLESVRMKAHVQGEEEIAQIVKSLGKLLRSSLEAGQQPIPLSTELELVRLYLDIQKFRFGNKLIYSLPESTGADGMMVLPMMLQPIVENAIIHGIENKMGQGIVTVLCERLEGTVRLSVSDNGNGIEPERLKDLRLALQHQEEESGQRIGIRNVNQRIKLHYGKEYGLELMSTPGAGTTVHIILPDGGGGIV
jgi:two-component system, sensor histidine kinase YesM